MVAILKYANEIIEQRLQEYFKKTAGKPDRFIDLWISFIDAVTN